MSRQQESTSGTLFTLLSGALIGAAGVGWWLLTEAERRQRIKRQRSMLYAPRMQDGSEAFEANQYADREDQLEHRVEQLRVARAQRPVSRAVHRVQLARVELKPLRLRHFLDAHALLPAPATR